MAFPQIRDNVVRGGVEPPTFRFSGQPVRREPGCVTFTAHEARDTPGRFYLYEVYTDAAAFATHLQTEHVHTFISTIPDLSTGGPGSLIQLNEIPVPASCPKSTTGAGSCLMAGPADVGDGKLT